VTSGSVLEPEGVSAQDWWWVPILVLMDGAAPPPLPLRAHQLQERLEEAEVEVPAVRGEDQLEHRGGEARQGHRVRGLPRGHTGEYSTEGHGGQV